MSSSAAGPEGAVPPMLRTAGAQGGPCYLQGGAGPGCAGLVCLEHL